MGRGTDTPFEHVGAPWIDGPALAAALNARHIPGVHFYPEVFTPSSSVYAGELCQGVFITIVDREAVRPVRLGVEIAAALWRTVPTRFEIDRADSLLGSTGALARLKAGDDPVDVAAGWAAAEARWRTLTAPYLLY